MEKPAFLCPKCGRLVNGFREAWSEEVWYICRPYVYKGSVISEIEREGEYDHEFLFTFCSSCRNLVSDEHRSDSFAVIVNGDKVEACGSFWLKNRERFMELVKELNMKPLFPIDT